MALRTSMGEYSRRNILGEELFSEGSPTALCIGLREAEPAGSTPGNSTEDIPARRASNATSTAQHKVGEQPEPPRKCGSSPSGRGAQSPAGSLREKLICTQTPACLPKRSGARMRRGYLEALKSNYGDKSHLNLQTSLESGPGNSGGQG